MKKYKQYISMCLAALSSIVVLSCADDITTNGNSKQQDETSVRFTVQDVQTLKQSRAITNASGVNTADFTTHTTLIQNSSLGNIYLTETTTPGVNPVEQVTSNGTRATIITKSNLGNFSSYGFCGSADNAISTKWFENVETTKNGVLNNNGKSITWSAANPYAKFYAVYPQVKDNNMTVSFDNSKQPSITFQQKTNVTEQVDLMTACTDAIHYDASTQKAPETKIMFRHALTGIRFAVGEGLPETTITKIEIANVKNKGTYTLSNGVGEWKNLTGNETFVLDNININTKQDNNHFLTTGTSDNYLFYMIPQKANNIVLKIYLT